MSFHRLVMSAVLAGSMACMAPAAHARDATRSAAASLAVDSLDVEQVAELAVGVPLNFTVFGTPRALAALRIDGGRHVLALRETEPGVYEGTYVIDSGDAIRPDSRVIATLQRGGAVAESILDEPLMLEKGTLPWSVAVPAPTATQTPTQTAAATPAPMPVPIAVAPPREVPPAALAAAPPAPLPEACSDCAVVESVRAVEAAPSGGVIGAIAGAVAGAILGKEAGQAHTQRVLSVLGAIGGAIAGREIERHATRNVHYDVVLRLPDGSALLRRYEQAPPFAAGDTLRIGAHAGRGAPVPASL